MNKSRDIYKLELNNLSDYQIAKLNNEGVFIKGWDKKQINKDSFIEIKKPRPTKRDEVSRVTTLIQNRCFLLFLFFLLYGFALIWL